MYLDNLDITKEQEDWCRKWLRQWYKAEAQLTNKAIFSEFWLLRIMKIELSDRCRAGIIRRIEARYNQLRRKREREDINKLTRRNIFPMEKPNEGTNN